MRTALIVEDDARALLALSELVEQQGYTSETASSFSEAKALLEQGPPDVVLLDVVLPDGSGIDLLLEFPPYARPQVILMSGDLTVQQAVRQLALHTVSFLRKPIDATELVGLLTTVRKRANSKPHDPNREVGGRILGSSEPMLEILRLIEKVAPTEFPVLIEGESGTGKELVAEAVHLGSSRGKRCFLAVNCGALPDTLVDSELFGHERGAFTGAAVSKAGVFEQANGGTLFLDELAEMPMELQARLLRVLETGTVRRIGGSRDIEVDVRVIAATNRRIDEALAEGRLREDLLHRLSVFPIHMPPLRQRKEDIDELTHHFLEEVARQEGQPKRMAPETLRILRAYRWPGNVRQLRNAVQRAYIVGDEIITPECLPRPIRERVSTRDETSHGDIRDLVGSTIAEAERRLIEATLDEHKGDKRIAAEVLGISLRTLYNRLREYGRADPQSAPPDEDDEEAAGA